MWVAAHSGGKKPVHIHVVCRGNVYRSRVVQAYLRSLAIPGLIVSTSGVAGDDYPHDYLSPWARHIGKRTGLTPFFSKWRVPTTQGQLDKADLIIFVRPNVYHEAKQRFAVNDDKTIIWHIKDREDWRVPLPQSQKERRTFATIKRYVDQLVREIKRGGWVDVVDSRNVPQGFRLPVTLVNQKGLWHRGCHVIISTPMRHTLIQKRSAGIIFSPGLVDITLGGHVDAGETPAHAMIREIAEEVGITAAQHDLHLLGVYKQARYHPRYKRHSNAFVYTYHLRLANEQRGLTLQKSEVALAQFIAPGQLKTLARGHRLSGVGRLNYTYAYYQEIAEAAELL